MEDEKLYQPQAYYYKNFKRCDINIVHMYTVRFLTFYYEFII
jgi:hypothetical protein